LISTGAGQSKMCGLLPEMAAAAKRIDQGLILQALGERSA
jgi:hypothetical protein